jgi:MFS family permease
VVLTILGDIFTLQERASIQGLFSAVWGTSALAGPALGAYLVNTFGWRSIFFVNLPAGLLGLGVLAWKYRDVEKPHSTDLDLPGALALAAGCTAILLLVSRLGPEGWSAPMIAALCAVAIISLVYFGRHERRAGNPILPMHFLFSREIGPSIAGSFVVGLGFLSLDTYVPLYVQGGRGGGATAAASVVTPVMLTWALSSFVAAPLLVRWGFRKTALIGASLIAIGFAGLFFCAQFDAPHWVLTAVLSITGFGFGPASMSYLLAAQDSVAWQQRGIATSAVGFFRSIGGAVGIGILGAMFNTLAWPDLQTLRDRGIAPTSLLDPAMHGKIPPDALASAHGAIASALTWVFLAMGLSAVSGILVTTLMRQTKCEHPVKRSEGLEALAG